MGLPQVFRTLLVFLVLASEGLFLKEVPTGCISAIFRKDGRFRSFNWPSTTMSRSFFWEVTSQNYHFPWPPTPYCSVFHMLHLQPGPLVAKQIPKLETYPFCQAVKLTSKPRLSTSKIGATVDPWSQILKNGPADLKGGYVSPPFQT